LEDRKPTDEEREQYHDQEAAHQVITEDALSVEVRSDWHNPGQKGEDTDYLILLCTGGPAVRITGSLDQYGQPASAILEYQDWFTPWTEYFTKGSEREALLSYARCFYFGEGGSNG